MSKKIDSLNQIAKTLRSHPFVTPRFLQSPHIQTLFARAVPYFKITLVAPEKKLINLPDGSQLIANCWFQKDKEKHATVIFLSGLEGYYRSEKSKFGQGIIMKAYFLGYNAIHLKQRGEGDSIHLTKSLFNAYLEDDLQCAMKELRRWGLTKLYLVGLSAGGYLSLFEPARMGSKATAYIRGIVAVSPPLNFLSSWKRVETQWLYNSLLLYVYKNIIKRRTRVDPPGTWDESQLKKIKTKSQWLETYMHHWGYPEKFSSLEEYNKLTDVSPLLAKIKVPTLIISAYDDPVIPIEPFLKSPITNNPSIITLLPKHGGHGGFLSFKKLYGDLDRHWAQNRAMEFIKLLDAHHH